MKRLAVAIGVCLLLAGAALADLPAALARAQTRVMVVAHRGGGFFAPENTLAAIDLGIEVGADGVELDVRRTADGHYALMHDDTVDRTTDGTGKVSALSLAQVRALAIRWTPPPIVPKSRFPVPPDSPRFRGLRVPTLEEALKQVRGRAFTMVDLKAEDAEGIARVVAEQGMVGEVIFKVNSAAEGEAVRRAAPEAVLLGRPKDKGELEEMLAALNPPIVHLDERSLTADTVRRLDERGALIWMNTLGQTDVTSLAADTEGPSWLRRLSDALGTWRRAEFHPSVRPYRKLAEQGVDFIQTDNIVTVVEAMAEYRKPPPKGR